MICLLTIGIGSWQINVLTPKNDSCQTTAFRDQINGQFLGNSTVQYIDQLRFVHCMLQPGEDSYLLVTQLVTAYANQLVPQQCSLTSTNCESIENQIIGWGFGIGFSILILLLQVLEQWTVTL